MAILNNQRVARLYCSSGNLPRCHGLALGHMHRGLGRLAHGGAIFDAQLTGRASGSQVRYGERGCKHVIMEHFKQTNGKVGNRKEHHFEHWGQVKEKCQENDGES
mgnify:CR=1 FL=1